MVISGNDFAILGILGIWEKMCSVGFSLVFEFLFCWGILLSRVSFLFGAAQEKTINERTVWWTEGVGFGISSIASSSLGDRKKGYPKRQALWELALALGRLSFDFICFLTFFVFFCVFHRFSLILL